MSKGRGQNAIASCYFHSGMPSLMRNSWDRYRLAIARGGKLPRFSFEKRTEASARILRYHRVDEDNSASFWRFQPDCSKPKCSAFASMTRS
jgi:hypothetical protein